MDIVQHLKRAAEFEPYSGLYEDAAAEIERLRAELAARDAGLYRVTSAGSDLASAARSEWDVANRASGTLTKALAEWDFAEAYATAIASGSYREGEGK